jgi:hypothetical protein
MCCDLKEPCEWRTGSVWVTSGVSACMVHRLPLPHSVPCMLASLLLLLGGITDCYSSKALTVSTPCFY